MNTWNPDDRPLKLHATIVNTIYAKSGGRLGQGLLRFDATEFVERFKDSVWAEDIRIEKIAICKMGAKKLFTPDGKIVGEEYEMVASVDLP